ncbi:TPA: hypothetical protein ACKP7M_003168 [Stenotrophomonas maltophilia]
MTITKNGAPVGTKTVKALASTDSWQSPSDYVDPLTGKVWRAETLQGLFDLLEENNVQLFDHDAMRAAGKTTAPSGGKRGKGPGGGDDVQWDRLLIQLQHYPDPEKARQIIVEVLANPNVAYRKQIEADRFQDKEMKGRRAVLAHEVHHDDERGPHFMAQVHTVALKPDGHLSQKWSFTNTNEATHMVVQINEALASHGLAPLIWRKSDETGASVAERKAQLDAQQSEEYREAAEKGELPPLLEDAEADAVADAMPTSAKKENLRQAAQSAGAQAASLYAQAAALQKQNAMYRTALRALENEEQHLARIGTLTAKLEEATANAEQAEAQHAATVAEQATVIEQTQVRATELAEQLETTAGQLSETAAVLETTEADLADAQASLAAATAAKGELETSLAGVRDDLATATAEIEQLENRLENSQTALAQAKEQNTQLVRALDTERLERKNEAQAAEAELADVRDELASERKAREKLESQLETTRSGLADERTAHNAVKVELQAETRRAEAEAKRAGTAETAAAKAQSELAALREQLASVQAQAKAQAADLERERLAREQAEQTARVALSAQATAEAQRDARPTQSDLQAALSAQAKAEAQRDALADRLEQLTKPQDPAPGSNGPAA